MTKPKVFIDGEAGTTGLEIRKLLDARKDIEMLAISADMRKDAGERKKLLNAADLAILCLPDDAAREAVALVDNPRTKILDASTAHRIADGWTYGFPELTAGQEKRITASKRVANPGCYPTGALALIRPLIDGEILPSDYAITITAISGYSGGGRELIAICENPETKGQGRGGPFCLYGLDQKHKHLPEMRVHGRLAEDPIFLPAYSGAFYRGMLVTITLRLKGLKRLTGTNVTGATVRDALARHFANKKYVKVEPMQEKLEKGYVLSPLDMNETNNLQLRTIWSPERDIVTLNACLDNLGKGAAGAAVQNMDLMLGLGA